MQGRTSRHGHRSGQPAVPASVFPQEVLLVCHSADVHGLAVMENICTGLDFTKIRFSILDLRRRTAWPALDAYKSVIICTEMIWELPADKAARLEDYVYAGGGLLIAYRCWNEHLSEMFGAGRNGFEPDMHLTSGLRFDKDLFPGSSGLEIDDSDWLFEHSRFDIEAGELSPGSTILASDLDGRPILWVRLLGKGRLVYWNTGVLFCRALRGFIVQSILDAMQIGVGAIAGFAMFHVDDFPTSLSSARLEPVASEFPELDWDGFFFGVWHDDMMALRAKHNLNYTWYTIMNYHDVDTAPGADPSAPQADGRNILEARFGHIRQTAAGDEYGFHGYNHEPMTVGSWPDLTTLRSKLQQARKLWESTVPAPMPTSWVPANNWYHAEHVRVLRDVFPELSSVCGLFSSGEAELGEYREFGPEPWENSLLCLPRETYGYVLKPELRMMMLSQIACMGVWTHFVHPDDVYDIPSSDNGTGYHRNPQTLMWRAAGKDGRPSLFAQLDDWIAQVRSAYPWLEFVTTSEAESRYRNHVENQVEVVSSDGTVEIRSNVGGLFYVRTRREASLHADEGGNVVDRRKVEDGLLHIVRCSAGRVVFRIEDAERRAAKPAGTEDDG